PKLTATRMPLPAHAGRGSRTAGVVAQSSSVDNCYGLNLDEEVGREQCRDADKCAWGEQRDAELLQRAGAAFPHERHLVEAPVGNVGGQFRDIIECAAGLGDGSGDVEVTLFYLPG